MRPEASHPANGRLLPQPVALSVIDDAGATHRHDLPIIWFLWLIREREPAARAIRRQQMMMAWDVQSGLVIGVLIAAISFISMSLGLPGYIMLAAAFAVGVGAAWVMWRQACQRIEASWDSLGVQWTDAGLSRGRCPLCLYSLIGAETERDLTQCPECSATWRTNRIVRAAQEPPPPWRHALHSALGITATRRMHDDLGRPFSAQKLRTLMYASADPPVRAILARVIAAGAPLRIAAAIGTGVFFAFPVNALAQHAWQSPQLNLILALLIMAVMLPFIIAGIWCGEFGLTSSARRRKMLAAGLCPVCASTLPGEPDDDLDLTCPGCDARWRSPN